MTTDPRRNVTESDASADCVSDAAAWVDKHGDALYRFARARIRGRELAEDLVQETFLAALSSQERFRGQASTRTWLLGILRRRIADHYRRSGKLPTEPAPDAFGPSAARQFDDAGHWLRPPKRWKAPAEALEQAEFRAAVDACLERLPQHLSDAFVLREQEDMDIEQLSRKLELSAANLRVRLHRARLLLRECLERTWFRPAR